MAKPLDMSISHQALAADENVTVVGRKGHYSTAPLPGHDALETNEMILTDPKTGADVTEFGFAYTVPPR